MAEDFEKDKANSSQPEMSFEDEGNKVENLGFPDRQQKDNPFEKNQDNPFAKPEDQYAEKDPDVEYKINNERIDNNKSQTQGLVKILLVLLLTTGVLVAAIFGMFQNKDKKTTNNEEATSISAETPPSDSNDNVAGKLIDSGNQSPKFKAVSKDKYCKISEAQKYVSASVNDLDRVLGLVEGKIESINQDPKADKTKQVPFLKNQLEELSRAEGDIRSFSEPHLEKDLAVSFREDTLACKVKDGPKYLYAWLEDIKERINSANAELDYVGSPEAQVASSEVTNATAPVSVAAKTTNKTTSKPSKATKDQNGLKNKIVALIPKLGTGSNKAKVNKNTEASKNKVKPSDKALSAQKQGLANNSVQLADSSKDVSAQNVRNYPLYEDTSARAKEQVNAEHLREEQLEAKRLSKRQAPRRVERCTNDYYEDDYYESTYETCPRTEYYEDDYSYAPARCHTSRY